jgi:hypothetical protein
MTDWKETARALLAAVTPRPWAVRGSQHPDGEPCEDVITKNEQADYNCNVASGCDSPDAALIAAAPTLIQAALEEVERLEALQTAMREQYESMRGTANDNCITALKEGLRADAAEVRVRELEQCHAEVVEELQDAESAGDNICFRCDFCAGIEAAARFRAAMTAMSRFMTFVWMEVGARGSWTRADELARALITGRLRLVWNDDE